MALPTHTVADELLRVETWLDDGQDAPKPKSSAGLPSGWQVDDPAWSVDWSGSGQLSGGAALPLMGIQFGADSADSDVAFGFPADGALGEAEGQADALSGTMPGFLESVLGSGGDTAPLGHAFLCGCPACAQYVAEADDPGAGDPPSPEEAPSYINALVANENSYRWNAGSALGTPVTVTFSFMSALPSYHEASEWPSFAPLTTEQKEATRDVLAMYASLSNITFVEVSDSGNGGQLRFGTANVTAGGFAYYAGTSQPESGDICISSRYDENFDPTPGTYGFHVLTHEVGHALGLKHTFTSPALPSSQDSYQYSVMSYTGHPYDFTYVVEGNSYDAFNLYASTPQLYDIAAIQHLYGTDNGTKAGNTVYSWGTNEAFIETIWDGGGTDTIDFSNQVRNATISLVAGTFSSLGPDNFIGVPGWVEDALSGRSDLYGINNLAIAFGATIENAIGGSGNDSIIGNDVANTLTGSGGNDTINGGSGDDTLRGSSGNDSLVGGNGNDTAVYQGNYAAYQVAGNSTSATVSQSGGDGSDQLSGIEYLQFADQTITLGGSSPPGGGGGGGSQASVSISGAILVEGNAGSQNANFTVTLSAAQSSSTIVTYNTVSGTATAGSDFTAVSGGTVTIPAGATTATIAIPVAGDTIVESDETFSVQLSATSGQTTIGSPSSATATIANDDTATVTIAGAQVVEGTGGTTYAYFTVSLSSSLATTTTVNYSTAGGSAAAGTDFASVPFGSVTIFAGNTTAIIQVPVTADALLEGDETFSVTLTGVTGGGAALGAQATATGTIIDDDAPAVSIANASAQEGDAGTVNAVFTVSLSAAAEGNVVVRYQTINGTATAGSDYTANADGTVTIPAGAASATISVAVASDDLVEGSETFGVVLTDVTGDANLGQSTAIGTILDDDGASVSIAGGTVTEGDSGTRNAVFTVTLSAPSASSTVISYKTETGTAAAGSDYTAVASASVTIPAGASSATISVPVAGDTVIESDETFAVRLTGVSGNSGIVLGTPATATATIIDDDAATVSVSGASVTEGDSGSKNAGFTIQLSKASTTATVVSYATAAGTATAGTDFAALGSGSVTIPAGATSATVNVAVLGDLIVESDETFSLSLTAVSGAPGLTIDAQGSATATILDNDDGSASLSADLVNVLEGDASTTSAQFTVLLSAPASVATVVTYHTVDGIAEAGSDYVGVANGAVTIAAGATSATFTVAVLGDAVLEGNETFTVVLDQVSGDPSVSLAAPLSITATILDDDTGVPIPVNGVTITANGSPDAIQGSSSSDHINGGEGSDTLFGLDGGDLVEGGTGNDILFGDMPGSGDDSLLGGAGADTVFGGGGNDTQVGDTGDDFLIGDDGDDIAFGDDGNDVAFGGSGNDSLVGGEGNDFLFGDGGANTLDGGAGNDRIHASAGDAFGTGSDGVFDVLVLIDNAGGITRIDLGTTLNQNATGSGPVLQGFEAVDASIATAAVQIAGAAFNGFGNVLFGSAFDDTITGSTAADIILGNAGDDSLVGGAGNDTIFADAGDDTLTGGSGADEFFFPGGPAAGDARITDFALDTDSVLLAASLGLTAQQALTQTVQVGADAVLNLAGGASVTLAGVSIAALGVNDFAIV